MAVRAHVIRDNIGPIVAQQIYTVTVRVRQIKIKLILPVFY